MNMLKWLNNKKKDNKGFSLVELIIVVAIMAILVGLLAPQYIKYVEKSRKSADASNLSEMVNALQVYAGDSDADDLPYDEYTITIDKDGSSVEGKDATNTAAAKKAIESATTDFINIKLKSKKWKDDGTYSAITAKVKIEENGSEVSYNPGKLQDFVGNKK